MGWVFVYGVFTPSSVTHEVPLAVPPPRPAGRGSRRNWAVAIHALEAERAASPSPGGAITHGHVAGRRTGQARAIMTHRRGRPRFGGVPGGGSHGQHNARQVPTQHDPARSAKKANRFQIACPIVNLAILEKVYIASMIGLIGAGCLIGLAQAIGKEVGQMAGGIIGNPNIPMWGRRPPPPPPPPPDSWPVIIAKLALMTIPVTVIVLFFVLHPWTD